MESEDIFFDQQLTHSSFPIFPNFLPNHGRILPALTYNGSQPLNANAGRILPGFGRKLGNIGKLDSDTCDRCQYELLFDQRRQQGQNSAPF